ncbi:hypothetical protein H5410_040859, partial [Solanum commersonii]
MKRLWKKLKHMKIGLKDLNTYMASYGQKLVPARQEIDGTRDENLPSPNVAFIREGPCLKYENKCSLVIPVTEEVIILAIKSMHVDKSPRIDGFLIEFFIKNWTIVKSDVVKGIQDFLTR